MNHSIARYEKAAIIIIIILHAVGIMGIIWPATRLLMITLTPANLAISALLLIYGHSQRGFAFWLFFSTTFIIGFFVEVIGINTGLIFGNYSYGSALGLQIFDTPLLIGINWFIVSYTTGHLCAHFSHRWWVNALAAAAMMTVIDVIIEPVAVFLTYWRWEGNTIPLSNYTGWFFTSLVIQMIYSGLRVNRPNKIATPLLVSQLVFFLALLLFIQL